LISLSLILLLYTDSPASEPLPLFAHIREPLKHALQYESLNNDLSHPEDITDLSRLRGLLNHRDQDEYPLNSYRKVIENEPITSYRREDKYTRLSEDTKYLALILATASASLYFMPEELTKWSKEGRQGTNIFERWARHVRSRPVWDADHWAVNYIGHPYAGSAYYILARHNGLDWKEAGLYSTFVSTFMWEYGVELTGEVPSIQDLIVTPIGGMILGEVLLNAEDAIKRNDGRVLGSRLLGSISLVLIDPAGSAIRFIRRWTAIPARIKIRIEPFTISSISDHEEAHTASSGFPPVPYYGMKLVFTYE